MGGELIVDLINVQGLTDLKACEIGKILGDDENIRIIGLVETQEKYKRVEWMDGVEDIAQRREMSDKKGGGMLLITREENDINMGRVEEECRDILVAEVCVRGWECKLVLVYLDTGDTERNVGIYGRLDAIIESSGELVPLLVFGDFNGHVGYLGEQRINGNGRMLLEFIEKWNLIMLNMDDACEGLYTRVQGEERSVIDYYLVNEKMYDKFRRMKIDEDKDDYDMSDHCYLSAVFQINKEERNRREEITERREYYRVKDKECMKNYVERLEAKFVTEENMDVNRMECLIKETADECLKKPVRIKKSRNDGRILEQKWMTAEIRREIKKRKRLNREKRGKVGGEYENAFGRYKEQKERVKALVKEAKSEYEKGIAMEIKMNKNGGKMWKMIDKLRGKEKTDKKSRKLYDVNGNEVERENEGKEMMDYWTELYQRDENRVRIVWNDEKMNEYRREREVGMETDRQDREREREMPDIPRIGRVGGVQGWMDDVVFEWRDVLKRLKKIKNGKQPGPDRMKGEIYKAMMESEVCMRSMAETYNRVLDEGLIGDSWKNSRTCMIPKVSRPGAKQHRPIALTNVGYKVFMGMIKEKLSEQSMNDRRVDDLQCGFTDGRRMEENLFILSVCVEQCFTMREELVVVAIDFSKAFDSVERKALIEAMMYYKCDPRVIEVIACMYVNDRTQVFREGELMGEVEVRNGIRQGCTGSPRLFVMVVSMIIERVIRSGMGYEVWGMRVPVLFYADDGLILARSREEAVRMVNVLEECAGMYGLSINRDKSACMVFNEQNVGVRDNDVDEINGIRVVTEMRYLGVTIGNVRDCFKLNRKEKIGMAEKMMSMASSVIVRACDRVIIGKTYWKSVVLPSVLSADGVIAWRKNEREKLQRIENGVWRRVFKAASHTPVVALQGEIGCSSVEARDMRSKVGFVRYLIGCENSICRRMMERMIGGSRGGFWMRMVSEYMESLDLTFEELAGMNREAVVGRVREWDTERWRSGVESRETLEGYRMKENIGGVEYDNSWGSVLMFRARSNTLRLRWRGRFVGEEVVCPVCGAAEETLRHFLLECEGTGQVRRQYGVWGVGDALGFARISFSEACAYLEEIWRCRGRVLDE